MRALGQLGDPRFSLAVLKALGITVGILIGASWLILGLLDWALPDTVTLWILSINLNAPWLSWAAVALLLGTSVFLMLPIAFVCVGLFLDDIADAVEARHYPHLAPAPRLSMAETIRDVVAFMLMMIAANTLALVVYIVSAPLAPLVFWAINGYLLGCEYFQLLAARRLSRRGARRLRRQNRGQIWAAGVLMTVPLSVPVLNLAVPLIGVAAYTHMAHRLMRTAPI